VTEIHEHTWLRLPVLDTTAIYACEKCPATHRVTWLQMIPSVSHLDILLCREYGGTVRGEYPGASQSLTLSARIRQVRETGCFLEAEDLMTEPADD